MNSPYDIINCNNCGYSFKPVQVNYSSQLSVYCPKCFFLNYFGDGGVKSLSGIEAIRKRPAMYEGIYAYELQDKYSLDLADIEPYAVVMTFDSIGYWRFPNGSFRRV